MQTLVADTSGLVSLGIVAGEDLDPLSLCLESYAVTIPRTVKDELEDVAEYDDVHGSGAEAVLERLDELVVRDVTLDDAFPLDDGENAAVTLANELKATIFLSDEFNSIGLIHASLADTRLVTTPTLLSVFVRNGQLSSTEAVTLHDRLSVSRSWSGNSYVERARALLDSD